MKELEGVGGVGAGRLSSYSLYLIIDHLALIRHLALVREIVDARKFAVVIPATGTVRICCIMYSSAALRSCKIVAMIHIMDFLLGFWILGQN